MRDMRLAIIPAYNEEKTLADVLLKTLEFVDEIVVINDGSSDGTENIALTLNCTVLSHVINRGLGSALRTGFTYALLRGATFIVTLDADGQHNPEDIGRLYNEIEKGFDVVIGSRMRSALGMPWHRIMANTIGNIFSGGKRFTTDSQSGLRAFRGNALAQIELLGERMEISSEIIDEVRRKKLRYSEIEIQPLYTEYSLSKGQGFKTGIITLFRLLFNRFVKHK